MGIFRNFPYSNFHEMNMDWIISKIKELINEWLTYNENWELWKNDITTAFNELKTYVEDYFANLDIRIEVENLFDKLTEQGFFSEIASQLLLKKEQVVVNMVGSMFNPYVGEAGAPQGACYIGNGLIAQYLSRDDINIGNLVIIDNDSYDTLYTIPMDLKHGNSLTYKPDTHEIYSVSLCTASTPAQILPEVKVIDMTNISSPTITRTFNLPMPQGSQGVYSLCYDHTKRVFAATCKASPTGGANIGEMDRIVIYNSDLTAITDTVFLEDHLIDHVGIMACENGIAYFNNITYTAKCIRTYDIETGKRISAFNLPKYLNGYRYIGELESIIYNWDNFNWYGTSAYMGSGTSGYIGLTIMQFGFYQDIPEVKLDRKSYNLSSSGYMTITVNNGAPGVVTNANFANSLMDAINFCVQNNIQGDIRIADNSIAPIGSVDIFGYVGSIQGSSNTYAEITGAIRVFGSKIRFAYCNFNGKSSHNYVSGEGNIAIWNSIVNMQAINFTKGILISDSILLNVLANWSIKANRCIITSPAPLTAATLTQSVVLQFTPA